MSPEEFAVFWFLKREGVQRAEQAGRDTAAAFRRFPHWQRSPEQEREVRKALYKTLIGVGVKSVVEVGDRILQMLRRAPS